MQALVISSSEGAAVARAAKEKRVRDRRITHTSICLTGYFTVFSFQYFYHSCLFCKSQSSQLKRDSTFALKALEREERTALLTVAMGLTFRMFMM